MASTSSLTRSWMAITRSPSPRNFVPIGVVRYDSALAFHGLTDRIPRSAWMAIGPRDWRPKITRPRIEIMRFGPKEFDRALSITPSKVSQCRSTPRQEPIVDLFKSGQRQKAFYSAPAGITHATQAMKDALRDCTRWHLPKSQNTPSMRAYGKKSFNRVLRH